jgi:hypothetical protein
MSQPWMAVLQFLFIVAVPLVAVGGGLATLFLVGFVFDTLENPESASRAIESAFRRPPKPSKAAGPDHYYRPYWHSR